MILLKEIYLEIIIYIRTLPPSPPSVSLSLSVQVRVDTGIVEGSTISMYYDPMISKVTGHYSLYQCISTRDNICTNLLFKFFLFPFFFFGTENPWSQRVVCSCTFYTMATSISAVYWRLYRRELILLERKYLIRKLDWKFPAKNPLACDCF